MNPLIKSLAICERLSMTFSFIIGKTVPELMDGAVATMGKREVEASEEADEGGLIVKMGRTANGTG